MALLTRQFQESSEAEDAGMPLLVHYFESIGLKVIPANIKQQLSGIDFTVIRSNKQATTAEAKFDQVANRTGNFFIEIISNTNTGKLGWAITSKADDLYYCVWVKDKQSWDVHRFNMAIVQIMVPSWEVKYRTAITCPTLNAGYYSKGILVPEKAMSKYRMSKFEVKAC